mgnify:CR=1 FL=1
MKRTISAVLCAALALTLAGCAEEKEPMLDRTVTVETTAAQTGELSTESTYIGTISAEGTASVVSLVSGNVEEVMVSVGDTVSAGDPLCRIDDESARLALQNAQAAYQSARESYNSAQAGYGGADLPVLEEQLRQGKDVLYIAFTSGLSGTCSSAPPPRRRWTRPTRLCCPPRPGSRRPGPA